MRVLFVTDRQDSHATRFSTALNQSFHQCETVLLLNDSQNNVSGSVGGIICEGWEELRSALDSQPAVIISGPLDSVTANLAPTGNPHFGISWATDVMVAAAADEVGLRRWQETVLTLSRIVTDNRAIENALIAVGVPVEKVIRFAWGPEASNRPVSTREDWGLPESGLVGLFGRSLDPHYDPLGFVEVLDLLRERGVRATWCFLDQGTLVDEMRAELIGRGLEGSVVWFPSMSPRDFNGFLQTLDCVVSTPRTDGTSVTVLEAMRARVPVVTTLTSGSAEWIVDGITGWSCPVGNSQALASAIQDALTTPASRRSLITANAFRLVEALGGWEKGVEKLVEAVTMEGKLGAFQEG
jgi:glycosyltransferase involved in cell wall biosynthesis